MHSCSRDEKAFGSWKMGSYFFSSLFSKRDQVIESDMEYQWEEDSEIIYFSYAYIFLLPRSR